MRFRYWGPCTIPFQDWSPDDIKHLPFPIKWARGQAEIGDESLFSDFSKQPFYHWQVVFNTTWCTLNQLKNVLPKSTYLKPSGSISVDQYVWKDDTRDPTVDRFEIGRRVSPGQVHTDWDQTWNHAVAGEYLSIPANIRIRYWNTFHSINRFYLRPSSALEQVTLLYGASDVGKSRMARTLAGRDSYSKKPTTRFWDGYRQQPNVRIEEFRGGCDVSDILRWLDCDSIGVECKFGEVAFSSKRIWITSNLAPDLWYPGIDLETKEAIMSRMRIFKLTYETCREQYWCRRHRILEYFSEECKSEFMPYRLRRFDLINPNPNPSPNPKLHVTETVLSDVK